MEHTSAGQGARFLSRALSAGFILCLSGAILGGVARADDDSISAAPVSFKPPAVAHTIKVAEIGNASAPVAMRDILPLMGQPVGMMAPQLLVDAGYAASILTGAAGVATTPVPAVSLEQMPATDAKTALYLKLMELNGTSGNVRMILKNAKDSIRMVVIERAGTVSLTPQQELIYDQVASDILKQTEGALIADIARNQSAAFSETEIAALIRANDTPAARKYNAAKYIAPNEAVSQIQSYMVDAVYKILKNYKQASAS